MKENQGLRENFIMQQEENEIWSRFFELHKRENFWLLKWVFRIL